MSLRELEERVTALEQQVAALTANGGVHGREKDWRSTIGMFSGDDVMKQIFDEGRKIREADRRKARRRWKTKRRAKA